jgi:hypothetical protein
MWDDRIRELGLDQKPLASATVADCVVEVRRQPSSNDLWAIATGPLGRWPSQMISGDWISERRELGPLPVRRAVLPKGSVEIRLDDDFALHVRARGRRLGVTYLYQGFPFGGGDVALPSGRRLSYWQRLVDVVQGRRGDDGISFLIGDDEPKDV